MTHADQPPLQGTTSQADLEWNGQIPVSTRFDDPYFSLRGGLEETRHVFLRGNDLPARLCPGFHVAELGFGTGLNLLALAEIADVGVSFTSFEAYPMDRADLCRAHAAFPELAPLSAALRAVWPECVTPFAQGARLRFSVGMVQATILLGDVRRTLPDWDGQADAWFLDGFSPAKNPEMWASSVMTEVARHTRSGGSFATYTAAGHVRRSLDAAGFDVTRAPGFAGKRHMSIGWRR